MKPLKLFNKVHNNLHTKTSVLITVLLLSLLSACNQDKLVGDSFDCLHSHWEYEGPTDPEHWTNCYSDCGGTAQSPIDISQTMTDKTLGDLQMDYQATPVELVNNGHTVKFDYHKHGTIKYQGEDYDLAQFHFHTVSEHTVNGKHYPMEVHLVHKNASGTKLLVVGIFVKEGQENAFLKTFSSHLPADAPGYNSFAEAKTVNVKDLYPANQAYYTYSGSLTTPPCSQTVRWIVMEDPVEASADQLHSFEGVLHHNYRPTQDLNGRQVREHL